MTAQARQNPSDALAVLLEAAQLILENSSASTHRDDPIYLSVDRAAKRQDVNPYTIRRMIDRGELRAYKFGRSIRIKVADLDKAAKRIKTVADLMEAAG